MHDVALTTLYYLIYPLLNINFSFLILYPTHFKLLSKFCINACFIISPSSNNYKAKSLYYHLSLERTVGAVTNMKKRHMRYVYLVNDGAFMYLICLLTFIYSYFSIRLVLCDFFIICSISVF